MLTLRPRSRIQRLLRQSAYAVCALLCSLAPVAATAQEAILKSEELIRLQMIPLSRPVTFEAQYTEEQIDYLAWALMRAIDTGKSWNAQHRAWNLYYVNVRHNLEQELRRRWQTSAGVVRSLSQNPQTALAKYYADTLSAAEIEEGLEFFRSASGKKYTLYLRELSRVYYRGLLELQRALLEGGEVGDSAAARAAWLRARGLSLDPLAPGYELHVTVVQRTYPGAQAADVAFALVAGAPPATESFRRLDELLGSEDRDALRRFLASSFAAKEKQARKLWSDAIAQTRDLPVPIAEDLRGVLDVGLKWKKLRENPAALPRSIARVEPESIEILDHYKTVDLDDPAAPEFAKTCLPGISDAGITRLKDPGSGRSYRQITQTLSMPNASNIFIARQGTAACVSTTAPGYPVPAISSFTGTVRVLGMDEEHEKRWYRAVAQEIAADGSSQSLIVFPNGNAYEVSFAVSVQRSAVLIYSTRFMRARTYDVERYRTVQRPANVKSVRITGSGTAGTTTYEKSLVATPDEIRRELGLPPTREKPPVRQQQVQRDHETRAL